MRATHFLFTALVAMIAFPQVGFSRTANALEAKHDAICASPMREQSQLFKRQKRQLCATSLTKWTENYESVSAYIASLESLEAESFGTGQIQILELLDEARTLRMKLVANGLKSTAPKYNEAVAGMSVGLLKALCENYDRLEPSTQASINDLCEWISASK